MKQMGYGHDYKYAHDYPGHFVRQQFLPDNIKSSQLWNPADNPAEQKLREVQKSRWNGMKKY